MKLYKIISAVLISIVCLNADICCSENEWYRVFTLDDSFEAETAEFEAFEGKLDYIEKKIKGFNARGEYIDYYFDALWQVKFTRGWLKRPPEKLERRINWMRERIFEYEKVRAKKVDELDEMIGSIRKEEVMAEPPEKDVLLRYLDLKDGFSSVKSAFLYAEARMRSILKKLDEADISREGFNDRVKEKLEMFRELDSKLMEIKEDLKRIEASKDPVTHKLYGKYFDKDGSFSIEKVRSLFWEKSGYLAAEEYLPFNEELEVFRKSINDSENTIFTSAENIKRNTSAAFEVRLRGPVFFNRKVTTFSSYVLNEIYSEELEGGYFAALRFKYTARKGKVDHFLVRVFPDGEWKKAVTKPYNGPVPVRKAHDGSKKDGVSGEAGEFPEMIPEFIESITPEGWTDTDIADREKMKRKGELEFKWVAIAGQIYHVDVVAVDDKGNKTNPLIKDSVRFIYMGRSKRQIIGEAMRHFARNYNSGGWESPEGLLDADLRLKDEIIGSGRSNKKRLIDYKLEYSPGAYQLSPQQDQADILFSIRYKGGIGSPVFIVTPVLFNISANRASILDIREAEALAEHVIIPSRSFIEDYRGSGRGVVRGSFKLYHVNPGDIAEKGFDFSKRRPAKSTDESDIMCGYDGSLTGGYTVDMGRRSLDSVKSVDENIFHRQKELSRRAVLGHTYSLLTREGRYALVYIRSVKNKKGPDSYMNFDYLYQPSGGSLFSPE